MSQENVEMLKAAFQAFEENGLEAVFDFLAPDIEWQVRPDLPDAQTYWGIAAIPGLFARFTEVMDDIWMTPQEFIPANDHVIVPLRWGGRGKGSGLNFEEQREAWIFTIRDGRIVKVQEFATKDEALEAAGLSE